MRENKYYNKRNLKIKLKKKNKNKNQQLQRQKEVLMKFKQKQIIKIIQIFYLKIFLPFQLIKNKSMKILIIFK